VTPISERNRYICQTELAAREFAGVIDKKNVWSEALTFHFSPLTFCANPRLELGAIPKISRAVIVTTLRIINLSFTGRDELLLTGRDELPLVGNFPMRDQLGEIIADEQELIPTAFSVAE
jgi:hypothetical protein